MSIGESWRAKRREEEQRRKYDWSRNARPEQRIPDEPFRYLLHISGRGGGKTRTGAETMRIWAPQCESSLIAGATREDLRNICIEGPSGILAVCPESERPEYQPSNMALLWPSGGRTVLVSSEEKDRFRGHSVTYAWLDELASWKDEQSWLNFDYSLRGPGAKCIVTSTPRPSPLSEVLRKLETDPRTIVRRYATYSNRKNLDKDFVVALESQDKNSISYRQEVLGEWVDDVPGALWDHALIESMRMWEMPR